MAPSAQGNTLAGVSCASTTSCIAVGGLSPVYGRETPLALRWNGARWTTQRLPDVRPFLSLLGVSCPSRSACTAVGDPAMLAQRSDGMSWRTQRPAAVPRAQASRFNGASCATRTTCVAVGTYLTTTHRVPLAERWRDGRWTLQLPVAPAGGRNADLNAVSCPSTGMCIAVGSRASPAGAELTMAQRFSG